MTMLLYTESRGHAEMKRTVAIAWGAAVLSVALLNIADVLPDWATFAAVMTLPFVAGNGPSQCMTRMF